MQNLLFDSERVCLWIADQWS